MKRTLLQNTAFALAIVGAAFLPSLQAATVETGKGSRLSTSSTVSAADNTPSHKANCPMQKTQSVRYVSNVDTKGQKTVVTDGQKLTGDCDNRTTRKAGTKESQTTMACPEEAKTSTPACSAHAAK